MSDPSSCSSIIPSNSTLNLSCSDSDRAFRSSRNPEYISTKASNYSTGSSNIPRESFYVLIFVAFVECLNMGTLLLPVAS